MQSTEVYSDSSCESAVSLKVISTGTCTASDCASTTIESSTYYTATTCPSNVYERAQEFYGDDDYLLVDIYSGTDCTIYVQTEAFAATGECEVASTDGQSVIATLHSNGSAQMAYYLDALCIYPASSSYAVTEDDIKSHTCSSGRKFYSSSGGSETNGVGISSSSSTSSLSASTDGDGGSGISGGAIVGIIVGVLFVVVLVGVLVYRRCRRRQITNQGQAPPDFSRTINANDAFYEAQPSPAKIRSQATTTISDSGRRSSTRLWDDDVIVAARIPREKVTLNRLINRGGYGEVYIGSYHGEQVAVKMLLPETKKTMSQVNAFLLEVKLMASLDHPRIVSFVGVAWDQLIDICVVSEYMAGGDLKALLTEFDKENRPVGFNHDKVKIALDVAIALTYLHSCAPPVIHRDLKSKNILLDEVLNAKVTDFGISRERIDATMTGGIGTSFWMAPEVMMGERYDDKADMFSFGVVLSELDSHVTPYSNAKSNSTTSSTSSQQNKLPSAAILQMVAAGKLRVQFSEAGPQSMIDLGLACVSLDPKQRPTAAEALYKLQKILAKEV